MRLQRGLFDTDIFLDDALLNPRTPTEVAPSPLLRRVALDVAVAVERPVRVRNNLADLAVRGEMRVRGDLAEPLPYGRLEVVPGGVVYLQTRKFTVQDGSLSFDGTLDPEVSLRAETEIREPDSGNLLVTVAAEGPARRPQLTLTSDPSFSERELASLIATGPPRSGPRQQRMGRRRADGGAARRASHPQRFEGAPGPWPRRGRDPSRSCSPGRPTPGRDSPSANDSRPG